jgi:putative ABC transport system permease protein
VPYAFDSIRRRPGRSVLTILGIGLATGLVIILLAISAGVQASATELAASSGVDLIGVSGNTSLSSAVFPLVPHAHSLPSAIPAADQNVATASPWLVSSLTLGNASLYSASNASPSGSGIPTNWTPAATTVIGWIPADNAGLALPSIVSGPGFTVPQDLHWANGTYTGPATHEVVLDQELAGLLNASVGDIIWANPAAVAGPPGVASWYVNATPYRVVGISTPFWLLPSVPIGFFYLSELQSLVGFASPSSDYASVILVHLNDPTSAATDQSRLAQAFPGLTFFTLSNVLGAVQNIVDLYRTFGTFIGIIGLVVATLFTTTVLLMSVDDRSREIALRRAVGFPAWSIGSLVAQEAAVFVGLGLALGIAIGWAGAFGLNWFLSGLVHGLPQNFTFVSFDVSVLTSSLIIVVAIGLASGLLPILRAVRLPIAEELRAP